MKTDHRLVLDLEHTNAEFASATRLILADTVNVTQKIWMWTKTSKEVVDPIILPLSTVLAVELACVESASVKSDPIRQKYVTGSGGNENLIKVA